MSEVDVIRGRIAELEFQLYVLGEEKRLRSLNVALRRPETCPDPIHMARLRREQKKLQGKVNEYNELTVKLVEIDQRREEKLAA